MPKERNVNPTMHVWGAVSTVNAVCLPQMAAASHSVWASSGHRLVSLLESSGWLDCEVGQNKFCVLRVGGDQALFVSGWDSGGEGTLTSGLQLR